MRRVVAVLVLVAIVAALGVAWKSGYFDASRIENIRTAMRAAREVPLAGAWFTVAWSLAVVLLLPTTALSVVGGALFGMPALALTWLGGMAGSLAAHSLGRYTGRFPMRRFLERHPLLERLSHDMSVLDLMRLRVLPLAPFGVLDYLTGMSGVSRRLVMVATAIAIVPTMGAWVYAGRQIMLALDGRGSARGATTAALAVTAVMVIGAVAPSVMKLRKRRK